MDFGKIRLGNWVITKYKKQGVPFIRITPVSGEFGWEYSELNEMYHFMESALDDEGTHTGLQTYISIMGMFLNNREPLFYDLYLKCLEVYGDIAQKRNPTTREEEREIIEEMKVEYELREELDKEEKGC